MVERVQIAVVYLAPQPAWLLASCSNAGPYGRSLSRVNVYNNQRSPALSSVLAGDLQREGIA